MELLESERPQNQKQLRFCSEYIIDSNGKQAAIRAGYSERSANSTAARLLMNDNVKAEVARLFEEVQERNRITIDELVQILSTHARFDIGELYNEDGSFKAIHDIPKKVRQCIEEIQVDELWDGPAGNRVIVGQTKKIKISNKQNAIEKLLKYLGAYGKDNEQKRTQIAIFQIPDNNRPNR